MAVKVKRKWLCVECGYVHEGETPPSYCPQCGAPREAFTEITE